jgi:hypothetical protein
MFRNDLSEPLPKYLGFIKIINELNQKVKWLSVTLLVPGAF